MGEPFIGEIKMVGFNFAPRHWAQCNGQIIPVSQNPSLYALIGTTFGGNGNTDFALPDMRGRVPVHTGNGYSRGMHYGAEAVTLSADQLGGHTHAAMGTTEPGGKYPPSSVRSLATSPDSGDPIYGTPANLVDMNSGVVTQSGGRESHNNMQPFQVINFCIALQGIFPSRN